MVREYCVRAYAIYIYVSVWIFSDVEAYALIWKLVRPQVRAQDVHSCACRSYRDILL